MDQENSDQGPTGGWHKILEPGELPDGRVRTVTVGRHSLAVTCHQGVFGALDNRCPHQGGPLGEGSIENGWLRCPWHGYDYNPTDGSPPRGFDDAPACYPVQERDDGVYVALPAETARVRTVSDVMVETLVSWGVRAVFGMVGHSNLGFADALREAEQRGDLRFYGIRHEGAASFAATAYGKLTGGLAACFAIAGPGSTNLMTGLYDAKVDRAPVLALCGQVPSSVRGRGAFQDVDLEGAFADVAAYNQTVSARSDHAELVNLACKTALVQRDVALLVMPDEVQVQPAADGAASGGPGGRLARPEMPPSPAALDAAVARVSAAERPLFVLGAGARFDAAEVVGLAEQLGAPMATTFKAKGQISDHHALGCGVLGRSGTPIASWFMNESDLIVAFGASFSNHTGIAPYKPIVQVDYDPMALGRFHPVDVPVLGHVGVTARALAERLAAGASCGDHRAEVAERWAIWRQEKASRLADNQGRGVSSAAVFDSLSRLCPADAVIAVDVGNNTYSFGRYFETRAQSVLMSGYLGSIGFGFPAAMGAWAAVGDSRPIISVSGDGGFGQYAMELTTAVKYNMDITHVLLNNSQLGKISKEQRAGRWDVWQTALHNPDFADYANLCGALGLRVTSAGQLDDTLQTALSHPDPALVEIICDPDLV
ncbi:thiamine pyrophosphate-binding protein [Candidatus Poriferisocius sp.]|uniref:thiamine pyrophosphate-binding protein n=1 Tax=Candidatus Poriferisocius sp. TaxID=3101276 RepID=UPI003B01FE25